MWVLKDALHEYFKMQVGAGRAAGRADLRYFLTTFDQIAFFDKHFGRMGVTGDQIIAVVNLDHIAIGRMVFLGHHHTARCSQYRGALT